MNQRKLSRRNLLHSLLAAGAVATPLLARSGNSEIGRVVKHGRINQSASRWCYNKLTLDELCEAGHKLSIKGIDLLSPKDFPTLKKYGLVCTMTSGGGRLDNQHSASSRSPAFAVALKRMLNMASKT